jgi:hypothetical protein
LFNPDPKYKTQVLAKTCRDVAQQGENKGRWKELTEQADRPALVGIKFFLFFHYFFYIFLRTRIKKDATTKIGTYN